MGDKTLTYDSVIKDRLVSIDGTPIIYNTNNPLNPSQYGDYSYLFEGRRLEMLNDGNDVYSYVYNDQGLRIEKKMNGQIINKYIYDGDKLVTDIVTNYRLDFLYDENGMLYGFIKDNIDKYFYIRDCMQNIIGINGQNGEIVVKYNYDAWGKLLSTIDTSSSGIGILNPFRHKGYYYDQESKNVLLQIQILCS